MEQNKEDALQIAKDEYKKVLHAKNGFWAAQYLAGALASLREAGFDTQKDEGYQALGTTKVDFDALWIPKAHEAARQYYAWSLNGNRQGDGNGVTQSLQWVEGFLEWAGYDFETETPYEILGTTKEEYKQLRKDNAILSARHDFNLASQDGYDMQSCLWNARRALKGAGFSMEKEETYSAIGTTKENFEKLAKECGLPSSPHGLSPNP